jgi:hypothetical protein
MMKARELIAVVLLSALGTVEIAHAAPDVLPAWNLGAVKTAILNYVDGYRPAERRLCRSK